MKKSELNTTTFPQLFAFGTNASVNLVQSDSSGLTYQAGIPCSYASRSGKKVVRGDINGMGRMITQSRFFNQCGGYYTFDASMSDAIGGYPLGAILSYKDPTTGMVRRVRSLVADNTYDFVESPEYIDGEHWSYVDEVVPVSFRPRIFPDFKNAKSGSLTQSTTFTADEDMLFTIQSGPSSSQDTVEDETCVFIYASVKRHGEEEYHAAGMLAVIPPVSSAYDMTGVSSQYILPELESKNNYTAYYSSSPIQIYLHSGDTVKISENREFDFTAQYVAYPLKA